MDQTLEERIHEEGQIVFINCWDSGGPGAGADLELVWVWKGMFWVRNSNLGIFGPYKDLVAALKDHENLVFVGEATTDIKCDLLPFYRLRKLLIINLEESQHDFRLNGVLYRAFQSGRLSARKYDDPSVQMGTGTLVVSNELLKVCESREFAWTKYFSQPAANPVEIQTFPIKRCRKFLDQPGGYRSGHKIIDTLLTYLSESYCSPLTRLIPIPGHSSAQILLEYRFLDGGLFLLSGDTARKKNSNRAYVYGVGAFRWLLFQLNLTQPKLFPPESQMPRYFELESNFDRFRLRPLRFK